jgi:hypothetical protein
MKKGDRVQATYEGRTVLATVTLASPNGKSLVIAWDDGMLGGHVGMMPILQEDDGTYLSLIEGQPIVLTALS